MKVLEINNISHMDSTNIDGRLDIIHENIYVYILVYILLSDFLLKG